MNKMKVLVLNLFYVILCWAVSLQLSLYIRCWCAGYLFFEIIIVIFILKHVLYRWIVFRHRKIREYFRSRSDDPGCFLCRLENSRWRSLEIAASLQGPPCIWFAGRRSIVGTLSVWRWTIIYAAVVKRKKRFSFTYILWFFLLYLQLFWCNQIKNTCVNFLLI